MGGLLSNEVNSSESESNLTLGNLCSGFTFCRRISSIGNAFSMKFNLAKEKRSTVIYLGCDKGANEASFGAENSQPVTCSLSRSTQRALETLSTTYLKSVMKHLCRPDTYKISNKCL